MTFARLAIAAACCFGPAWTCDCPTWTAAWPSTGHTVLGSASPRGPRCSLRRTSPGEASVEGEGANRVTIVGLATDYCVRATALDALREGFAVTVDRAGVRGIDARPGDADRALREVEAAGGAVA